jgi:O-antigen ligase
MDMDKKVEIFAFWLFFATLMAPLSTEVAPSIFVYLFDFPLAALYLCLYMRVCLRHTRLSFGRFDLVFLFFYAWLFFTSLQGKNFNTSLVWLLYWLRGYLIIFYMRHTIGTFITEKVFFYVLGFCLVLEPALAVFQAITQSSVGVVKQYFGVTDLEHSTWRIYGSSVTRAQGTLEHTNYLGNWLVMLMPFLQVRMIYAQKRFRLTYVLWWLFCLVALILTFSRANWMAFLLGGIVVLFGERRYRTVELGRHRWLVYVFVPMIVVVAGYTLFTENFEYIWELMEIRIGRTFEDKSSNIRSDLITGALIVLEGNPFMGVGLGNSKATILASNPFIPRWFNATVHNIYLILTTESGVIGGSLFVIIMFWPLIKIWKALRRHYKDMPSETLDNTIAFLGCFVGLYFAMLWYVGMLLQCEFPLIMTLVGSALGLSSRILANPHPAEKAHYVQPAGYLLAKSPV